MRVCRITRRLTSLLRSRVPRTLPEPSDVAVTETFTASQNIVCPVVCVGSIDTNSTASSDTHTPYDTSTIPVLTPVQLRRLWYRRDGGRTPASTLIVILLSGLSGFLIAGTFFVVAMAIARARSGRLITVLPSKATRR